MAPSCPDALPEQLPVVVAGGGPAGFMAAICAAEAGVKGVHLLEATPELLHKVRISGGGRCNVTHACWDPCELVGHYPRGSRALRGPFSRFAAGDSLAWFADHGLELVEEADGRLFPRANRSTAVIDCLRKAAAAAGVQVHTGVALQAASSAPGGGFSLQVRGQAGKVQAGGRDPAAIRAGRLVLATGSHPSGRRLAAGLGHSLVPSAPSLFTLALAGDPLLALAGVSMEAVGLSLELPDGSRLDQQGPVLITHWGLSGPATLRLTAFAARDLQASRYQASLKIDWSGGRSAAEFDDSAGSVCQRQAALIGDQAWRVPGSERPLDQRGSFNHAAAGQRCTWPDNESTQVNAADLAGQTSSIEKPFVEPQFAIEPFGVAQPGIGLLRSIGSAWRRGRPRPGGRGVEH